MVDLADTLSKVSATCFLWYFCLCYRMLSIFSFEKLKNRKIMPPLNCANKEYMWIIYQFAWASIKVQLVNLYYLDSHFPLNLFYHSYTFFQIYFISNFILSIFFIQGFLNWRDENKKLLDEIKHLKPAHKQKQVNLDSFEAAHKQKQVNLDSFEAAHKQKQVNLDSFEAAHKQKQVNLDSFEAAHKHKQVNLDTLKQRINRNR